MPLFNLQLNLRIPREGYSTELLWIAYERHRIYLSHVRDKHHKLTQKVIKTELGKHIFLRFVMLGSIIIVGQQSTAYKCIV